MAEFKVDITKQILDPIRGITSGVSFREGESYIGEAVVGFLKEHFLNLSYQRHRGFTARSFYSEAAKSVKQEFGAAENTPSGIDILVKVNHPGLAVRYFGGTITAGKGPSCVTGKLTKYLTIPAIPEAHGKSSACYFGKLKFVKFGKGPDAPAALIEEEPKSATVAATGKKVRGKKWQGMFGQKNKPMSLGRRVFFWLAKSTTHRPDPSVLPPLQAIEDIAAKAAKEWLERKFMGGQSGSTIHDFS